MKKFITFLFVAATITGCGYDDSHLWDKVDDLDNRLKTLEQALKQMNNDIAALQSIVDMIEEGGYVTTYAEMSNGKGWILTLSNGQTLEIFHGETGADAPIITIKEEDGVYYWATTIDGVTDFMYADEAGTVKIQATGSDGADAVTPKIGVDDQGYWTVDYGDGEPQRLQSNGKDVMATDDSYTYLFVDVVDNGRYYTFYLADGSTIELVKRFGAEIVIDAGEEEYFRYGQERMFKMELTNVSNITVSCPRGWTLYPEIDDEELWVIAPAEGVGNSSGTIRVTVTGVDGPTMTAQFNVKADTYLLHTITFEGDYWEPFVAANYNGQPYSYSVLNGNRPYSYPEWVDATTQLTSVTPSANTSMGYDYPFILSSYNSNDVTGFGTYTTDLYVYNSVNTDSTTGGGRNGSDNFIVGYGYEDLPPATSWGDWRTILEFDDGVARTIQSLYVNSTNYFLSVVADGNGLSPALGPDEDVTLIATGYDGLGNVTGEVTMEYATYQNVITEWTKWDLSGLGDVVRVKINIAGGTDNGWGFSLPAYYAFDDITVVLP